MNILKRIQLLWQRIRSKPSQILITTGILVSLSLISRLIGLVRDRLLTSEFGTGGVLDSYFSAFRIPDLVYNILILGTLSSAFIPIFSQLIHKKNKKDAQDLVDDILLIVTIIMGSLGLTMLVSAPWLTRIVALSYEGQKFQDTVDLTRIMAFSPLIFSISSVISSILHTYKKFFFVALAPIFYNIGIIVGILFLYPTFGVMGLGYGVILGAALHLFVQLPAILSSEFRFRFSFQIHWKNLQRLWKLYWPRLLVIDTAMISLFIGTIVASAQDSAVSVFSLAFNINALPLGVLAISFVTTIFPYLSESYAQNDEESFRTYLTVTMSRIIYVLVPIMALMLTYRAQIVRIIYGGGAFGWDDTRLTIQAFTLFALSIPFQGLIPLFSRALYARHNTKTPMIIGIVGMIINTVLSIGLLSIFGVEGVALAFSLTMLVVCLIYATVVFRLVNHGTILSTIWYGLQVGLASLLMLAIAYLLRNFVAERVLLQSTTITLLVHIILSSLPALGIYALITWKTNLIQRLRVSNVRKELSLLNQ